MSIFQPASSSNPEVILEMQNISKFFTGVNALRNVDFNVYRGEVHVVLGENGAGKSTLMKILAGVYPGDTGQMKWRGRPVQFKTPREAQQAGINIIYQESSLISHLSVAENVFLGHEPARLPGLPFIDWGQIYRQTQQLLEQLDLHLDPHTPVARLGVAEQRMVEVAKALRQSADLIIMDEPTASLSHPEVETLFRVIRTLTTQGVAIVYISHRLEETMKIGHRATILRDGQKVATVSLANTPPGKLLRLIVGRNLDDKFPQRRRSPGPEILRVKGLTRYGVLDDISFNLRAGEIVGLTGLMGSGRTALVRAIFGLDPFDEGTIYIDGQPTVIGSPQEAINLGIGLLTENREEQGLILEMNTADNITLAALERDWPGPFLDHAAEQNLAEYYIDRLNIKPPSPQHLTRFLSSGMQQKVILSRWLATKSRVLIFDHPTRGVDVGSKVEFYRFMADLAEQGVSMLMVSSELPEILGMCDRILVLHQGTLVASLRQNEATAEAIMAYATGGLPK
ncbi:MAG: sugar ABC transporter ATP-binding protein [Anaerolineae bacterium]|nr:sugar ABC transporter ATP-binding protein [Anaerolineae bacterium]